jgi:short-subunit dehydrogenase
MCVVVTGAGGGIGSSLTKQLIASNAKVALLGRTKETLESVYSESCPKTGQADIWNCDVRNHNQVTTVFQDITKTFGSIDVLVNNAGVFIRKSLEECTDNDMQTMYNTNTFGAFYCAKEVLPGFLKQGHGHIINIASFSGLTGIPTYMGYSDSKAAVVRMSEVWRRELSAKNISITTVFNYYTATKMVFPDTGSNTVNIRLPLVPLQRAEGVARRIVETIKKPKKELWIPGYARLMMSLPILIPEFGDFLDHILPRGKPPHWRLKK